MYVCVCTLSSCSPFHEEVSAITMCGGEEGYTYGGRIPPHNGLIQTHSTPTRFPPFSLSPPIIFLSLHHLLPSISSLHLPDSRSSSSVCRRSHLFSLDMAFYLRSNSHHFNRDKITLRWAPVPAGPPACTNVCVCLFVCVYVCHHFVFVIGCVYLLSEYVLCLLLSNWPSVRVYLWVYIRVCVPEDGVNNLQYILMFIIVL